MNRQKNKWLLGLAAMLTASSLVLSDTGTSVAFARGGGHGGGGHGGGGHGGGRRGGGGHRSGGHRGGAARAGFAHRGGGHRGGGHFAGAHRTARTGGIAGGGQRFDLGRGLQRGVGRNIGGRSTRNFALTRPHNRVGRGWTGGNWRGSGWNGRRWHRRGLGGWGYDYPYSYNDGYYST